MLTCADCGAVVIALTDGTMERECEHLEAGVIASLEATVYGEGAVE
jgi:hypothetical protein